MDALFRYYKGASQHWSCRIHSAKQQWNHSTSCLPSGIRVSVGTHSQDEGILQSFNDLVVFAQDAVSQWRSNLNYAVSLNLLDRCLEWYQTQPPDIGNTILSRVPDCCQTEEKAAAPNSGFVRDNHDALVAFFHPDAASCYRQATITRFVCFMPVHSL